MTNRISLRPGSALAINSEDFLEVLRTLAHRLSQPLTSLRGSVEVALMGELDEPECRRTLELCLQETQRMAEVLEGLRDVLEMEGACEEVQPVSWTQSVEKFLEEAVPGDNDCHLELVSNVQDEVWVAASPQQLDTATARLIGGAIKAARGKREVRLELSVQGEMAYLSLCAESLPPDAEPALEGDRAEFSPGTWELGNLDWWVVRRAAERQGGSLKVTDLSVTCRCYKLNLPLASPRAPGKAQNP